MAAKILKSALAAAVCLALLLAGALVFRESLLRAGINIFLPDDIAVTRIEGVQLGSSRAGINALELSLGAAGQQLAIADIELDFSMQGLFRAPMVENLVIGSARLTNADAGIASSNNQQNSVLLPSELLQQLRNFPLKNMTLSNLEVPQFRQKLALKLAQQTAGLQLTLASGTLQLLATFTQQNSDATAQFMLTLQADESKVAELELVLRPQAEGYALAGKGNVEFSDANTPFAEYLTTPLPFSSIALQWDIAAEVTDGLLRDAASNIRIGLLSGSTFVLRPGMVPELGELAVGLSGRAELGFVPGAQMSVTGGTVPLTLAGSWRQQALLSEVIITPTDCQLGGTRDCSVGFGGTASLASYTLAGAEPAAAITIDAIAFSGNGSAKLSRDLVEFQLDAGTRIDSGAIRGPAYSIASLNIVNNSALNVSSALDDAHLTLAAADISLSLAELKIGEYQASPTLSLLDISVEAAEKLAGTMTVQTAGLAVTGPHWLPVVGVDAALSIDGDVLAFSTPLLLPNGPADARLQASGTYALAAGTGKLNINLPALALTGPGKSLSSWLGGWPWPADVMTGTLALDVDVQLQPDIAVPAAQDIAGGGTIITGSTEIVLTDVAGFYVENFFRGLNTTIDAAYDSSAPSLPVTTPPLTLTIDELNVGMPITDIVLNYQLDANSQVANISSISGQMLDGMVSGTDISYDFSKERNEMTFMFAGLRLERMLELSEYRGIEAIGAVSGELPVTISAGKVEVDAGKLYAETPGGIIRYLNAPPPGQGNPAMDLVNQALSNYQFQSLESTIDYTADGELLLGMQLRGHNPDMNGGQAINLNLNISDNIPQLLKSLQAGRAIEDFLQEQFE